MKQFALALVVSATFGVALVAQGNQSQDPARILKAAMDLELIDRNLAAAIEAYKKVVASGDRPLAARALLRMADCYEKLGSEQAQKIYSELAGKYADQKDVAAQARARIVTPVPAQVERHDTERRIWTLPTVNAAFHGSVSADGRQIAYLIAAGDGAFELIVRDLVVGTDRLVFRGRPGRFALPRLPSTFSKDGRKLAYDAETELRVADLGAPAEAPHKVLMNRRAIPYDWTPDGKWVAVRYRRDAATQVIALVSVDDGTEQVLKTLPWQPDDIGHTGFLSPDGRLLALEVPESTSARDIAVLAIDGTREVAAVVATGDDRLMGWSPDGAVVFASTRGGQRALWSRRVEPDRLLDTEAFIRLEGPTNSLGLTPSGALYWSVRNQRQSSIKAVEFDFQSGTLVSPIKNIADSFIRSNEVAWPKWSPDGRYLAYIQNRLDTGSRLLVVRHDATSQSRELPLTVKFRNDNTTLWVWMPDSGAIAAIGEDSQGRPGIHRIDIVTGQVSPLAIVAPPGPNELPAMDMALPTWSQDGRTMSYDRPRRSATVGGGPGPIVHVTRDMASGREEETFPVAESLRSKDGTRTYESRRFPGGAVIVERDVVSGQERQLFRYAPFDAEWRLTPDGGWIIAETTTPDGKERAIVIYSVVDGTQKTIHRASAERNAQLRLIDPKGTAVLIRTTEIDKTAAVWWVPFDDRQPRRLTALDGFGGNMSLNPDGRRIALDVRSWVTTGDELVVLENFLPRTRK